jgi:hypothetical protein
VFRPAFIALALIFANAVHAAEAPPSAQQMWALIQQQQTVIEGLSARLAEAERNAARSVQHARVTEQRLDATAEYVEQYVAESSPDKASATSFGGYGEFHYNNLDADDSSHDLKEADFHRFVGFIGHDFTDSIRLFAEVELEHSVAKDTDDGSSAGEVELEQAFIEIDLSDNYYTRSGVFLVPVGILNITHEPDTFFGVERNDVENVIIPGTWWEGGASLGARYANGLAWDVAVHTGLAVPTTGSNAFRIRSGRQKASKASAENLAYTAQLRYTGVPGLELAGTFQYQDDMSQISGDGLDEGQLISLHAVYSHGPFALRALWAGWDLDGDAVEAADADEQSGWYVEPSYRFDVARHAFGIYTRYEDVEAARDRDNFSQWALGLNYWPTDGVVFKFDLRDREHDRATEGGRDFTGFDLGVGYSF